MLPLGMVLGFAGYGVGTWGWILVRGYNITLREWFSPLKPFTGALDANGCVPQGSIFPKAGKGGPCGGSSAKSQPFSQSPTAKHLGKLAQQQGRPNPGGVPGRL